MGGCCSCLNPKDGSDKLSDSSQTSSPTHRKVYGTIPKERQHFSEQPKDTDRLVKSVPASSARPSSGEKPTTRGAPVPKANLQPLAKEPESAAGKKEEEDVIPKTTVPLKPEGSGHVRFAPTPPSSIYSEDTTGDESHETLSENEKTNLVSNTKNKKDQKDTKEKKKKHKHGLGVHVASKVTKKMKKAITPKKEEIPKRPKVSGPPRLERGNLERVSSSRMTSKYARERMEKLEKEREEREKLKHPTGFRDPRKAAIERGQKLGELEDTTGEMRNQAAGFAQTTNQLARAMKK